MTLTASPSSSTAVEHAAFADIGSAETALTSVDHAVVGRTMAGIASLVAAAGMFGWGLLSLRFDAWVRNALPSQAFLGADINGGFSFHRILGALQSGLGPFVVIPLFLGVATMAIPRQIGSSQMAFPRISALVLWGYVVSLALFVASNIVNDGPPQVNLASTSPGDIYGKSNAATNLFLGALMMVTVLTLLGAANIVATVTTNRRSGLRLSRVGSFSFASMVTSGVLLVASPVFLAGLGIVELDRHFGGSMGQSSDGYLTVWTHALWSAGRPEALLMILPGLGVLVDLIASRAGSRPVGGPAVNYLLGLYGALTILVWAQGSWALSHLVQPTATWASALVAIPFTLVVLLSLATIGQNIKNFRPDAALLAGLGMVLLVVIGIGNAAAAAAAGISAASGLWTANEMMLMTVAAPLLGLVAAVIHFAPASMRREANGPASSLAALACVVGFAISALAIASLSSKNNFSQASDALGLVGLIGSAIAAVGLLLGSASAFGVIRGPLAKEDK